MENESKKNFQCDFQEYQNDDMENAEIHIYISLSSNAPIPEII